MYSNARKGQQKSKVTESKVVQEKDDTQMSKGMQVRDRKQKDEVKMGKGCEKAQGE